MLTELCQELKNWFDRERYTGTFEIVDGNLTADFLAEGQYFRICGSIFNNGVHQWPTDVLRDETFDGAVWALAIPEPVIKLADDIDEWLKINSAKAQNVYSSENISSSGYSYQKSSAADLKSMTWQSIFSQRLNRWRKL